MDIYRSFGKARFIPMRLTYSPSLLYDIENVFTDMNAYFSSHILSWFFWLFSKPRMGNGGTEHWKQRMSWRTSQRIPQGTPRGMRRGMVQWRSQWTSWGMSLGMPQRKPREMANTSVKPWGRLISNNDSNLYLLI